MILEFALVEIGSQAVLYFLIFSFSTHPWKYSSFSVSGNIGNLENSVEVHDLKMSGNFFSHAHITLGFLIRYFGEQRF